MGNCCGQDRSSQSARSQTVQGPAPAAARAPGAGAASMPLRAERPVWSAPQPVTRREVLRQRNEFWDTAPSFEGRREIWDALRAACESEDLEFAQAVIDSARIKLPTGSLTLAYDELGAKYCIPVYCLSFPRNVVDADMMQEPAAAAAAAAAAKPDGTPLTLKVRLSVGQDLTLDLLTTTTGKEIKALVAERARIANATLMVFFCGKRLNEMTTLDQTGITQGDVLQVMVFPRKK